MLTEEEISSMEKTAKSLVDHWAWAGSKGLMNRNTAAGLRSACARVLEVLGDGWEQTDISNLDVEDLLLRFQNLRKKEFVPQVLETYKQRFRKAVASYFEYLENPGTWRPSTQEKPVASRQDARPSKRQQATGAVAADSLPTRVDAGYVEYPFPLRPGVMARLILPRDVTKDDVTRLTSFMQMLIVSGGQKSDQEER
jgi:hypothetical protein